MNVIMPRVRMSPGHGAKQRFTCLSVTVVAVTSR